MSDITIVARDVWTTVDIKTQLQYMKIRCVVSGNQIRVCNPTADDENRIRAMFRGRKDVKIS